MKNPGELIPGDPLPIEQFVRPFQEFAARETSAGIVLLVVSIIAFGWANSPWRDFYFHVWETKLTIGFGRFAISESLEHWINDGLMAIFFFVVGLEIKRELVGGELASVKKAMLPLMAALGGMVVPATIYALLNHSGPGGHGWGIPMATDIAFSLGILALLGNRIPLGLKVFLTALAIVDDLGAVLVIAIFYTAQISWVSLGIAGVCFVLLIAANLLGVRRPGIFAVIGIAMWVAVLNSGIHATIAGVLTALTIPVWRRIDTKKFLIESRSVLERLEQAEAQSEPSEIKEAQQTALLTLEEASEKLQSPLLHLEHALHPWVAFVIMPIFALANAGVTVENGMESLKHPVSLGIIFGLMLGKPIGILTFTFIAALIGIATIPESVSRKQLVGVGILAGIGFTMSLFISNLAFSDQSLHSEAKIGILFGSLIAGITGWFVLRKTRNVSLVQAA
ncbi:MAG TPA: Na+/H+ antiporter NhaA [Acidobacteriota bacterium]|nr:Na+/H+ antiporter NhaA [Acidobacteriota bacterium]